MASFSKSFCGIDHPFFSASEFVPADGIDEENVHTCFVFLRKRTPNNCSGAIQALGSVCI
jgi:hypothetical protein